MRRTLAFGQANRHAAQSPSCRRTIGYHDLNQTGSASRRLMKRDLADFDGFRIEPELRRFRIARVADEHIEQSLAVCLAPNSMGFAGEVIAATFAFIDENSHVGAKRGKEYATRQSSNTAGGQSNS